MRAKEFLEAKMDLELSLDDMAQQQDGNPELNDAPLMIPPLQQALEIDKAKMNPERAKKSKALRQLLHKARTTYLPNQPK